MTTAKRITKKWRVEKAREIIDRNEYDILFSDDDVREMGEVCQVALEAAVRKVNPQFPNTDTRHLHSKIGGVWDARSWRKWITQPSPEQEAKKVMRDVARASMREYRDSVDNPSCEKCGATDDLTVDHVCPAFNDIALGFISQHGLPNVVESQDPSVVINMFEDPGLEAEWEAYHASHAVYQMLCRSCNASKGVK